MKQLQSHEHDLESSLDATMNDGAEHYRRGRADSEILCASLCIEDFIIQAADEANPAYRVDLAVPSHRPRSPMDWLDCPGGLVEIGHVGDALAYDNESPRHRAHLETYRLASRPVSNGEYLALIESGGYGNASLCLSDRWATVQRNNWRTPLYRERIGGKRCPLKGFRLAGDAE